MHRFVVTFVFGLLLGCVPLHAAVAQDTPEAFAQAYAQAVRDKGVKVVPDFVHPDELARFKQMLLPLLTDKDSPIGEGLIATAFGTDATAESVAAMEDAAFMGGFMDGVLGAQMQDLGIVLGDVQVLGSVEEGELLHLVTRNTVGAKGFEMTAMEVVSMKPYQGGWKLMLSAQMEGMVQALKAQVEAIRGAAGSGDVDANADGPAEAGQPEAGQAGTEAESDTP